LAFIEKNNYTVPDLLYKGRPTIPQAQSHNEFWPTLSPTSNSLLPILKEPTTPAQTHPPTYTLPPTPNSVNLNPLLEHSPPTPASLKRKSHVDEEHLITKKPKLTLPFEKANTTQSTLEAYPIDEKSCEEFLAHSPKFFYNHKESKRYSPEAETSTNSLPESEEGFIKPPPEQ
jgi:hypothetical protein